MQLFFVPLMKMVKSNGMHEFMDNDSIGVTTTAKGQGLSTTSSSNRRRASLSDKNVNVINI